MAAHTVDAGAGRGRRGADKDLPVGRRVQAPSWAEEELAEVDCASGDVSADEVGVEFFEGGGI